MAIATTAAVLGATAIASAGVGAYSASKSAKAQQSAAQSANDTQQYIFERNVELSEPWREAGQNALGAMNYEMGLGDKPEGFGGFQAAPSYQFQLDEGMKAMERQQAARGMRLGGASAKEAMRYGTGLASQEYGNYYNRLASLSGVGQTATQSQMQAGSQYANAFGQNTLAAGNARASGYAGVNNAIQGGVNNAFQLYGMQQAGYFQ